MFKLGLPRELTYNALNAHRRAIDLNRVTHGIRIKPLISIIRPQSDFGLPREFAYNALNAHKRVIDQTRVIQETKFNPINVHSLVIGQTRVTQGTHIAH